VFLLNAESRKDLLKKINPDYRITFITEIPPIETFKAIIQLAIQNGYRVDYLDQKNLSVLLNERITFKNVGYLFPIYVREK
jgi:hypothetical protein